MNNVRSYTTKNLIDRFKSFKNFKHVPKDIWLFLVRSNEDGTDIPDDKCYVMEGEKCLFVSSATTNKGLEGTAVMMADWINYDAHKFGLHRGKMRALRQCKRIPYYRDLDKDGKTDEEGIVYTNIIYMNIHGMTYKEGSKIVATRISGWSHGCLCLAENEKYERMIDLVEFQPFVTSVVANEWNP